MRKIMGQRFALDLSSTLLNANLYSCFVRRMKVIYRGRIPRKVCCFSKQFPALSNKFASPSPARSASINSVLLIRKYSNRPIGAQSCVAARERERPRDKGHVKSRWKFDFTRRDYFPGFQPGGSEMSEARLRPGNRQQVTPARHQSAPGSGPRVVATRRPRLPCSEN